VPHTASRTSRNSSYPSTTAPSGLPLGQHQSADKWAKAHPSAALARSPHPGSAGDCFAGRKELWPRSGRQVTPLGVLSRSGESPPVKRPRPWLAFWAAEERTPSGARPDPDPRAADCGGVETSAHGGRSWRTRDGCPLKRGSALGVWKDSECTPAHEPGVCTVSDRSKAGLSGTHADSPGMGRGVRSADGVQTADGMVHGRHTPPHDGCPSPTPSFPAERAPRTAETPGGGALCSPPRLAARRPTSPGPNMTGRGTTRTRSGPGTPRRPRAPAAWRPQALPTRPCTWWFRGRSKVGMSLERE
jgi:hypothetical protein